MSLEEKIRETKQPDKIIVVNPGSTSTKVAIYGPSDKEYVECLFEENISHEGDFEAGLEMWDQLPIRMQKVVDVINNNADNISAEEIGIVMGRGGLLEPMSGGVYQIAMNNMILKLKSNPMAKHESNLGASLAGWIARRIHRKHGTELVPACIADPACVDELDDIARISGHPLIPRISMFHALNHKATALQYAREHNVDYGELNLVVAHMGGGTSIGAHRKGKVVDVTLGLKGYGSMAMERAGTLATGGLVNLCYSGKYTKEEVNKMLKGKGGVVAHLGTNDMKEVITRIDNGDDKALSILDAMAYQVAKEIGGMSVALYGDVDAILLTGGCAKAEAFTDKIAQRVGHIAPIRVYAGEGEMEALAKYGRMVLDGEIKPKEYVPGNCM